MKKTYFFASLLILLSACTYTTNNDENFDVTTDTVYVDVDTTGVEDSDTTVTEQ
jgi:hypothetical protein